MGLVSETIAEPLDLKSRPSLVPERCVNRRQRRYPCARCADICPHRVFPHKSGEALSGATISAAVEKREDQRKPDAFLGYRKVDRQAADHA